MYQWVSRTAPNGPHYLRKVSAVKWPVRPAKCHPQHHPQHLPTPTPMNTDVTYHFNGKVALVTGAASGIGLALAIDGEVTT